MPSVFNVLVCILALLVGVLIGKSTASGKRTATRKKTKNKRTGSIPNVIKLR